MAAILVVEDDLPFSKLLETFLEKRGYTISLAAEITTGKELLQKNAYDLLLLDYRLPDGSGMELLTLIREQQIQVTPIIMTSFHDVRTAVKTIQSGAYDYITKPVNPDEL